MPQRWPQAPGGWSQEPPSQEPPSQEPPSQEPPDWARSAPSQASPVGPGLGYTAGSRGARRGLVPLRPMSFGDIIDAVFRLLRANALAVAPLLILVALPFEVLIAYAGRNEASMTQIFAHLGSLQARSTGASVTDLLMVYAAMLGLWVVMPVVTGAVSKAVVVSYLGGHPAAAHPAQVGARSMAALLVASVLGHLLELVGFSLFLLPGLGVVALLFLTAPVIVLEGLGPVAGLRRSWKLVSRRFWPVLGTVLLGVLLGAATTNILLIVPDLLISFFPPAVRAVADVIVGTAGMALEWAIFAHLAALLYLDQRARHEGLDLEVMGARAL